MTPNYDFGSYNQYCDAFEDAIQFYIININISLHITPEIIMKIIEK